MKRLLIAALKTLAQEAELDDSDLKDLAFAIEKWTSQPDQITFSMIQDIAEKLSDAYKEYDWDVYRGQKISQSELEDLQDGKSLKIKAGSWSTDEDEAKAFAGGGQYTNLAVVYEYKPKKDDVILNLVDVVEDDDLNKHISASTIESVKSEEEIILDIVYVTKQNILSGHFTLFLNDDATKDISDIEKKLPEWKKKYGDIELKDHGNYDVIWVEAKTPNLIDLMNEMIEELDDSIDMDKIDIE